MSKSLQSRYLEQAKNTLFWLRLYNLNGEPTRLKEQLQKLQDSITIAGVTIADIGSSEEELRLLLHESCVSRVKLLLGEAVCDAEDYGVDHLIQEAYELLDKIDIKLEALIGKTREEFNLYIVSLKPSSPFEEDEQEL